MGELEEGFERLQRLFAAQGTHEDIRSADKRDFEKEIEDKQAWCLFALEWLRANAERYSQMVDEIPAEPDTVAGNAAIRPAVVRIIWETSSIAVGLVNMRRIMFREVQASAPTEKPDDNDR